MRLLFCFLLLCLGKPILLAQCDEIETVVDAIQDASTISTRPTENFNGSFINVYRWTHQGNWGSKYSFLQFDLSSIPADATITGARLNLFYLNPVNETFNSHVKNTSNSFYIRRVTSSWDEANLIWNNQPAVTEVNQITVPETASNTQNFTNIDVTQLTRDMVSNGNFGFRLSLVDESNVLNAVAISSHDSPDGSLHPQLSISYTVGDSQDSDNDGVSDECDDELNSPCPDSVDENGVSLDTDGDGVADCLTSQLCEVFFPTVITPNGNSKNDLFKALYEDDCQIVDIRVVIRNFWGNQVGLIQETTETWSPKQNQDHIYIWYAEYTVLDSSQNPKSFKKRGTVTVIN